MNIYYITFRSVTPAQRGEGVLKKAGVDCAIRRTPRWMEEQGCGYSLQLDCRDVPVAVGLLRQAEVAFRKIYRYKDNGRPEEMHL